MKLRLRSDFRDFYDSAFDNAYGTVFPRLTRTEMDRWSMMQVLEELGYCTPKWGTAKNIVDPNDKETLWVAHHDPLAHRGEAKEILCGGDAMAYARDCFVTQYDHRSRGFTYRRLQVGLRTFDLIYKSADDWRSNCGDVSITVINSSRKDTHWPWPLAAVDLLATGCAIDLNTSPGMTGTGIEKLITANEVVDEIKGWYRHHETANA